MMMMMMVVVVVAVEGEVEAVGLAGVDRKVWSGISAISTARQVGISPGPDVCHLLTRPQP